MLQLAVRRTSHKGNRDIAWIGNPDNAFVADRSYMGCQSGVLLMERDMELRVKGHLFEILEIDDEVIDNGQGQTPAMNGYRRSLENVADSANAKLMDEVAKDIKQHIRSREERPPNVNVRVDARKLIVSEGFLPSDYLNSA